MRRKPWAWEDKGDGELSESHGHTVVRLTQRGSGSAEEAEHSSQTWQKVLDGLKQVAEDAPRG
jgi:hypothetical protein